MNWRRTLWTLVAAISGADIVVGTYHHKIFTLVLGSLMLVWTVARSLLLND
jgi:hypothetical protein